MDQLRTDVFLDLCSGSADASRTGGSVDISVDLETLLALNDDPGDLVGYGPVIADIARDVAERQVDGEWRYTITARGNGQPLATGTTRRRPTASQHRDVIARNRTCVFPGCRMPSRDCDLDHRIPWAEGGPTQIDHLAPLCRHDHRIRHEAGWTYEILPKGDVTWTSRLGQVYTTKACTGVPP